MTTEMSVAEMRAAHKRTASFLHKTSIMSSENINEKVGVPVLFKCEHLQKTGSFKVRGALNSAIRAKEQEAKGVKEEEIKEALKLVWTRLKQRIEPSAALAFAGVLYHKPKHVKLPLVILCGGNVDANYVID
ncbi:hypothetical protein CRE_22074 [Caenorhabditis remanei]|uniref:Uncharacterized protein n=1 Tax=Caenorhabditis remanei TaxID=31234 RepID=E3N8V1_CAERE|nr:hypothetical protein CRE_22074 [Caenorhabditis remanei]